MLNRNRNTFKAATPALKISAHCTVVENRKFIASVVADWIGFEIEGGGANGMRGMRGMREMRGM